ncbi:MAG: c-type cytochrome biogenesis protein CcmI [Gammaproteobacteria bacterium]|nr:c-type cytochrome biogenesis protein CcmI [Gammaproteobacteria bacterium]
MTLFWIISAAMIVAALGLIAPTLLRKQEAATDSTEQLNVDIAREHLAELAKQKDAGDLSDEEFAQAKQDLEMALANDLAGTKDAPKTATGTGGGRAALLVSALVIPLIAVPLYLEIGSPAMIDHPAVTAGAASVPASHGSGELPPIEDLAAKLRERLEANPDNAEGWFLLGRTYMRMQDYTQATEAFERVNELLPDQPAVLLSLADAMTMRDGRRSSPRSIELLEKALAIDPNAVTALWLLGNAAFDEGKTAKALEYWQHAYPLLAEEPGMQAELGQMITSAGGQLPASPAALPTIMGGAPATPIQTTVAAAPTTAATPSAEAGVRVQVEVALAPGLFDQVSDTDTVFVLARAESGPPMPLAVARHSVAELPLQVTLTDAMAMMPAMKLSSFPRVKVTAKVSKSGQAGSQPGDIVSADVIVDSANPGGVVQLLLNQVVK